MTINTSLSILFAGTLAAGIAFAQTSPAGDAGAQPTDPSAASSPHQRAATKSPATESTPTTQGTNPGDASTPHQKQTTKKKTKKKAATPAPSSAS